MKNPTNSESASQGEVTLTLLHQGSRHAFTFPPTATLPDLSDRVVEILSIPSTNQKFLISPKPGLLKPPFADSPHGDLLLSTIASKKITLLGSTDAQISSLNKSLQASQSHSNQRRAYTGPVKPATPSRTRDFATLHDATTYTFLQLRPLPYLPNPERSLRYLERLRDDPGVRAAMVKHRWSVPLLTEMNPADHTTHESRTLGLNRNGGEVIELRLRTDSYDGYRDYKTIRKTLAHELTHCVHSEHNSDFWALCRQVEKEIEKADWKSGGRALTEEEFYNPNDDGSDVVMDHGGWTGGEFVLGTGEESGSSRSGGSVARAGENTMSRREILARAAEERLKKQKAQEQDDHEANQ